MGPLLWLTSPSPGRVAGLVDWPSLGALAGLMVLSRGLVDSGGVERLGRGMLTGIGGERRLALVLMALSAALAAAITNDVALFIVVPLTTGLRAVAPIRVGRLVVFEALAVNAGSMVSPVGNPQNLFLWQSSGVSFLDFARAMLPLGVGLLVLLAALVPMAFPAAAIRVSEARPAAPLRLRLLVVTLVLYPLFVAAADLGAAGRALAGLFLLYGLAFRSVLLGIDWLLLAVFGLMFVDLRLLASVPVVAALAGHLEALPGGSYTGAVLTSQCLSNVPATILLDRFVADWRTLAWGVNVGGFGLALGSLANLIALRLAGHRGLWRDFHAWSVPTLVAAWALGWALLAGLGWV